MKLPQWEPVVSLSRLTEGSCGESTDGQAERKASLLLVVAVPVRQQTETWSQGQGETKR